MTPTPGTRKLTSANVSFWTGIAAAVTTVIPLFGVVLALPITALVAGVHAERATRRTPQRGHTQACWGLALGVATFAVNWVFLAIVATG